ncbi:MAG: hypothetical protein ACTSSA_10605 [Candidatus Freyarchaeota archaeon]
MNKYTHYRRGAAKTAPKRATLEREEGTPAEAALGGKQHLPCSRKLQMTQPTNL